MPMTAHPIMAAKAMQQHYTAKPPVLMYTIIERWVRACHRELLKSRNGRMPMPTLGPRPKPDRAAPASRPLDRIAEHFQEADLPSAGVRPQCRSSRPTPPSADVL